MNTLHWSNLRQVLTVFINLCCGIFWRWRCPLYGNRCCRHWEDPQGLRPVATRFHVHLCCWFWLVLEPSNRAHPQWNFPYENSSNGSNHKYCCGFLFYVYTITVLLNHAMSPQTQPISVLWLLDCRDDGLCCSFFAGDKRNSFGENGWGVEEALVLASICWRAVVARCWNLWLKLDNAMVLILGSSIIKKMNENLNDDDDNQH